MFPLSMATQPSASPQSIAMPERATTGRATAMSAVNSSGFPAPAGMYGGAGRARPALRTPARPAGAARRGAVRGHLGAARRVHEPERASRGDGPTQAHREDGCRRRLPRAAGDVCGPGARPPRLDSRPSRTSRSSMPRCSEPRSRAPDGSRSTRCHRSASTTPASSRTPSIGCAASSGGRTSRWGCCPSASRCRRRAACSRRSAA